MDQSITPDGYLACGKAGRECSLKVSSPDHTIDSSNEVAVSDS